MRAARLPAWSSPNFFTTANGNAAHARRCCRRSSRSRNAFTRRWLPIGSAGSPSGFAPQAGRRCFLRPWQATPAEDEVPLRAPGPVRVLLEQAEPVDAEVSFVPRQSGERTVERVIRQVMRDGHVRVIRKMERAMQRTGSNLCLELFTL